ncbi:MAG: glycogen debranching protein GlgX [Geminicoccaceae bacterium]
MEPGKPAPLGATPVAGGVNFALASETAERVELCLFDAPGFERARHDLPGFTDGVWHGFLPGVSAGQIYGYRVHGPWQPGRGCWFNPAKLLLDPYAKALTGRHLWNERHLAFDRHDPSRADRRDNADWLYKAVVTDPHDVRRPLGRPWSETVIYEAHVKGVSHCHAGVPAAARGRFSGLASEPILDHLTRLGITAIELMPVQAFVSEPRLERLGLTNYWGYNTLSFFAPDPRYGSTDDFCRMVDRLHEAGIEVILDVVYNHTCEGDELGPTFSFRGIDNCGAYALLAEDHRRYINVTGTGNTLDLGQPRVLQLVMDSLRHWASMGVDGVRFDLATTLTRAGGGEPFTSAFLPAIAQDPTLNRLKLIAEPWDVGDHGYQVGQFPPGWAEWNDRFRDGVRGFWRGDDELAPDLAARLLGSADRFDHRGRKSWASINYVASHDGFTLRDVVSYAHKHNEANGEANNDGHGHNLSCNHGVEGPSDDPAVLAARAAHMRALLATTLLSQGTPMIAMGDEFGRTQHGNNNAYCRDSAISWVDWEAVDEDLLSFTAELIRLRKAISPLRFENFMHGEKTADGLANVGWFTTAGQEPEPGAWKHLRAFGFWLADDATKLAVLINGQKTDERFTLPGPIADLAEGPVEVSGVSVRLIYQ